MAHQHAPRGPIKARDTMREENPLRGPGWRGCNATSKRSGKPCNGQAIAGGTVCRMHGGSAPQVQQSAMARLRALQHPAVDALAWLIAQRDFPSAAMSAARDVMDRTEGKAPESVDLRVSGQIDVVEVLRRRHARSAKSLEEMTPRHRLETHAGPR